MRVAFISTVLHYPWGGADKLWTRAAEHLAATGHALLLAVSPLVAPHARVQALVQRGAALHLRRRFTTSNGRREELMEKLRRLVRSRSSLIVELEAFRPDFVFICQGGTYDFLVEPGLMQWLRARPVPFTLICQANRGDTVLDQAYRSISRETFAAARAVCFVSTHNLRLAERQIGGSIPQASLVQNPVELELRSVPWPKAQPLRFGVVARLESHDKGLDLLIPALAQALADKGAWQVHFYGRGPDEEVLRTRAAGAGLGDRLVFHGFQSDIPAIWRDCHALLLPSRHEGCSLAMLEALSCGRPVIATDVGGVSDWIIDGENGFVCPEPSVAALAHTLGRAWANRDRWPEMGLAASHTARRIDPRPERALLASLVPDAADAPAPASP